MEISKMGKEGSTGVKGVKDGVFITLGYLGT